MKKLLINVTPVIKALELTSKTALGGELIGSYKSRFRGRGVEFEEFGDYAPGDDAEQIDWKASVKANKLLIKQYIEERNLKIFFLIDVSNSMVYTTGKKLKAEYVGEMVISLAFLMIKNSDQIGYALFNDQVIKKAPVRGGLVQYYNLIDTLLNSKNYGGGYDFANALRFTFSYAPERSMVILISDFIGLGSTKWQEILRINARRFDIITLMVRDPADSVLPASKRGAVLKDPFSKRKVRIYGERVRERYTALVKQQEEDLAEFFKKAGASFLRLETSKSFVEPIISFFNQRKAELRRAQWK